MSVPRRRIGLAAAAVLVAAVASVNFLAGLGDPPHPIWDESYYLTAVARYEGGIAQFASHPPLGIALITAGDELLNPNRGIDTRRLGWDKKIAGDQIPRGYSFAGVRLAPGVFAVLGAVLFFALMYVLCESVLGALALANLYVFQNAFIVQFRAGQLDAFQIAFALAALLCFVSSMRGHARIAPLLDLGFGVSYGLANMVKVNVAVLALLGPLLIARRVASGWRSEPRGRLWLRAARDALIMLAGCFVAVAGVFTVHFALNRLPPIAASPAGARDSAFITAPYAQYLHRERPLSPAVVWAAAADYTRFMVSDFKGVAREDPNGSSPLEWLVGRGTINYRWDSSGSHTAYVQLVENPFSWMLGLAALLAALAFAGAQPLGLWPAASRDRRALILALLAQYLFFMAVHAYIGTLRVVYLYHYFIGLLLTFCLVPLLAEQIAERWPVLRARKASLTWTMVGLLWAGFALYAPLSYHWPLTHSQCEWRNVLGHVVDCQ
jgi:dolichyl-phosphate-mannose-protein mannosyltransferase